MKLGRVRGTVVASMKDPGMTGMRLLIVQPLAKDQVPDGDCVVAADGVNSRVREAHREHFKPSVDRRDCKFVWLGTQRMFEAFTFAFTETQHGWFQAHCYRFDDELSTFIVECPEATFQHRGVAAPSQRRR